MENIWTVCDSEKLEKINKFCDEYKDFLSTCKTERECINFVTKLAEENGYINLEKAICENKKLCAGDKVYAVNMGKAILLMVIGQEPMIKGMNLIGAHIDSPRLDLKATPIYENNGLCMFDTHYYGGIKKYQWTALPLALHGVVVKKNCEKINLVLGEDDDDFVLGISDLLPHLESKDKEKKLDIKGEDLNVLVGSIPDVNTKDKDKVKSNILKILKQYNIDEQDLFSAEIEIVPSGKARDFGLDKSMIMAYGQDDRVCAYTSVRAIMEQQNPKCTSICMLVDKEEIGSVGATGMSSKFFENSIAEIMNLAGQYNELDMRRALNKSRMLSSDVTAAFDPNYPTPMNEKTDAFLCRGIAFNKYTGSHGKYDANDANPEFIAKLRNILDNDKVSYQATEMGKVDAGGGGTIAYIMAGYGMEVIDAGVPLLNMHAPWEIASKIDIFESYLCYKSFYKMI